MEENYISKKPEKQPNYSLRRRVAAGIAGFIAMGLLYFSMCTPKKEIIIPQAEAGTKIELSDIAEYKKNNPGEFLSLVTDEDIDTRIQSNQETFNQHYNKINKLADSKKFELSKYNQIYDANKSINLFNSKPELSELCNSEFKRYQIEKTGKKIIGGIYEAGKDLGSGLLNEFTGEKQ